MVRRVLARIAVTERVGRGAGHQRISCGLTNGPVDGLTDWVVLKELSALYYKEKSPFKRQ